MEAAIICFGFGIVIGVVGTWIYKDKAVKEARAIAQQAQADLVKATDKVGAAVSDVAKKVG